MQSFHNIDFVSMVTVQTAILTKQALQHSCAEI